MKKSKKKSASRSKPLTDEQRKKLSDIRHLEVCIRVSHEQAMITHGDLKDLFENQAARLELKLRNLQE